MRNQFLILLKILFYAMSYFSFATFNTLFVFGFLQFDYDTSRCDLFEFILIKGCWASWICRLFYPFLEFIAIISSNIFVPPFFLGLLLCICWCLIMSHRFLRLFVFLHSVFCSFFRLDSLNWSLSKYFSFSAYLNLLLWPSSEFSFWSLYFSTLEF